MVINNAGGTFAAPLLDVSTKGEAALIAENFTQVTHLVRETVPHMGQGASIVNVTTIEAHRAAPGFAVYAAMKAGQANLTKSLALELAPRGIRVNALAPDAMRSEGVTALGGAASQERRALSHQRRTAHWPLRHARRRGRGDCLSGQRSGPLRDWNHLARRRGEHGRRGLDPHRPRG